MEHAVNYDLFDSPPVVVSQAPGGFRALALTELNRNPLDYDHEFVAWLKANWKIWTRFCRVADEVRARRSSYSARAIFHHIRLETVLAEKPANSGKTPIFKINNNYSAGCARLYNAMHPAHRDFFRTRESGS